MLTLLASSAYAQFAPPGGYAPYTFNAPETASSALSAGTVNSTAQDSRCQQTVRGRGGLQTQCPDSPGDPSGKK